MLSLSQKDFKRCVVHSLQIGLELFLLRLFTLDFIFDIFKLFWYFFLFSYRRMISSFSFK